MDIPEDEKGRPEFTKFLRKVYHEAMHIILEPLEAASHLGRAVRCGDGIARVVFPGIYIASMDFEEQYVY